MYSNVVVVHHLDIIIKKNAFISQGCQIAGCRNGGSCLFDKKKETFSCSCKLPWSGEKCDVKMGKSFSLSTKSKRSKRQHRNLFTVTNYLINSVDKTNICLQLFT